MAPRVLILHRVGNASRAEYIDRFVTLFQQAGAHVETLHLDCLVPMVASSGVTLQTNIGAPIVADVVFLQTTLRSPADRNKLAAVKAAGVPVVNDPDAAAVSADKHLTALALAAAGLPVVEHVLLGGPAPVKEMVAQRFPYPFIIKPVSSSLGKGVTLISGEYQFRRMRMSGEMLAQRYVPEAAQGDLRVFVVGGVAVAAMRRVPAKGEHRANLHQGGHGMPHKLTDAERDLAVRAADVIGLAVAGVDLIPTADGPVVLEVNSRPGYRIAEITGVDVRAAMVTTVLNAAGADHG
jgi:RimK family alpha-L-glutamate ligase